MTLYTCRFGVIAKLVGAVPYDLRRYLSLTREATLPFVPLVGMSIQLSYADIEEDENEDDSEDYVSVEHVHYDLPNDRFLCRCKEHIHGVENDWERKTSQLKNWGWSE